MGFANSEFYGACCTKLLWFFAGPEADDLRSGAQGPDSVLDGCRNMQQLMHVKRPFMKRLLMLEGQTCKSQLPRGMNIGLQTFDCTLNDALAMQQKHDDQCIGA